MSATFKLCYEPADAEAVIYRSIPGGICGPFSDVMTCLSREDAERFAFERGYLVSGEWTPHPNFDSADLTRMAW